MAADSALDREKLIECIRTDLGYGWHPADKIARVVRQHTDSDVSDGTVARALADLAKKDLIKQRTGYGTTRRWMVPYKPE
jgi:hypothetical protein